uniref:EF-hand domain-containing protein n=1 Tax=Timema bartmani TaxID=61472 RepID=A0A7R9I3G1_9NEOP|nr:unnamed protein product [Timema bartmani]
MLPGNAQAPGKLPQLTMPEPTAKRHLTHRPRFEEMAEIHTYYCKYSGKKYLLAEEWKEGFLAPVGTRSKYQAPPLMEGGLQWDGKIDYNDFYTLYFLGAGCNGDVNQENAKDAASLGYRVAQHPWTSRPRAVSRWVPKKLQPPNPNGWDDPYQARSGPGRLELTIPPPLPVTHCDKPTHKCWSVNYWLGNTDLQYPGYKLRGNRVTLGGADTIRRFMLRKVMDNVLRFARRPVDVHLSETIFKTWKSVDCNRDGKIDCNDFYALHFLGAGCKGDVDQEDAEDAARFRKCLATLE